MPLPSWLRLPVLALATLSSSLVSALPHSFENTAVVRTIDLGGSLVYATTTYAIRALEDGAKHLLTRLFTPQRHLLIHRRHPKTFAREWHGQPGC